MAKISARGDSALRTWTSPSGMRLVLTRQGRVLIKYPDGGYTLRNSIRGRFDNPEALARDLADVYDLTEV